MKCLILLLLVIVAVFSKPQHPLAQMLRKPNQLADGCKDVGTNCLNWARNGFCTNCNWTCEQRRHYCERTCGFCHPDYVCNETCPTWPPMEAKEWSEQEIEQYFK